MQAMETLGHFQQPGIVYRTLQHGAVHYHSVMTTAEWHDIEPEGLVTVYLCIQITIDKMQLCL
jgi:hypothetical protein